MARRKTGSSARMVNDPLLYEGSCALVTPATKEGVIRMRPSEVGAWLRQHVGKRDHRDLMPEDCIVLQPGSNFDWLMGNLAANQSPPTTPEPDSAGTTGTKTPPVGNFHGSIDAAA